MIEHLLYWYICLDLRGGLVWLDFKREFKEVCVTIGVIGSKEKPEEIFMLFLLIGCVVL